LRLTLDVLANNYFQFKQFRINQEHCAMKVSTEGCILGASVNYSNPVRILDIGAGTGLLALMLAQRYQCAIDAVEMESNAASQARQNFLDSSWKDRLNLVHEAIQNFNCSSSKKYDLIISNPPFFKESLKSINKEKNLAKHDDSLPKILLVQSIKMLLSKEGVAYVLLPEDEANNLKLIAEQNDLASKDYFIVKNKPGTKVFRKIIAIGNIQHIESKELIIRHNDSSHTEDFIALMSPYYLNF
jgi:tRNA1Val (adenine37-N6)-methyltransferase